MTCTICLRMFNGFQLETEGMIDVIPTHLKTRKQLNVEVTVTAHEGPILSINACRAFNLIRIVEINCAAETDSSTIDRT